MLRKVLVALLVVLGVAGPSWALELTELASGRWTLLFLVVPGCPACEEALAWFHRAAQAFPEIRFLLVAPWNTEELPRLAGTLPVYIDEGGALGWELGIRRAPTVLLGAEGVIIDQLDWPFTEGQLFRSLAESLLVKIEMPNPKELLGQPAPEFSATNLKGQETVLAELPRPLLLVFFSLGCPPCWEILPLLEELSKEVAIALLVFTEELAEDDWARLRGFLEGVEGQQVAVLLTKGFELLEAYRVARSPTYFLMDKKGVIAWVKEGSEGLVEEVRKQLEVLEEQGGVQCGGQC